MVCPRCENAEAYTVFEADDKAWEIYRCPRCNFNWRSTEGQELTDPKLYSPRFKLNEKLIQDMAPKPPVPPLRKTQGPGAREKRDSSGT
jgi:vanillate/4-hydroxybenzoate decarboxylase subunit D